MDFDKLPTDAKRDNTQHMTSHMKKTNIHFSSK
jgi:hypothetical protein